MLTEPEDLDGETVAALVREHWDPTVVSATHVPCGAGAHHWSASTEHGQAWFATADHLHTRTAHQLEQAYATARELADSGLGFVLACERTRSGNLVARTHDRALSLTRWAAGFSGDGTWDDDAQREQIADLVNQLHAAPVPPECPRWTPTPRHRAGLVDALAHLDAQWDAGPYATATQQVLTSHHAMLQQMLIRFAELADAAIASSDTWVLTHGEPHSANVIWSTDGPLLLDWESVALAPAERDLRVVGGGTRSDMREMFELEWRLSEVGEYAVRFRAAHSGSADDERCFADLLAELADPAE